MEYKQRFPNENVSKIEKIKSLKRRDNIFSIFIRFEINLNIIKALTVLPNGDLATGLDDTTIKIWNKNDGSLKLM